MKPPLASLAYSVIIFVVGGCSTHRPILYPNDHLRTVSKSVADQDIAACRDLAEQYGATPETGKVARTASSTSIGAGAGAVTGAVGGAIVGAAGRGAVIGAASGATAGLLRGLFFSAKPNQAYIGFVNRCLRERGYDVIGWD